MATIDVSILQLTGTSYLSVNLLDGSKTWKRDGRIFPCSYAFVQEKGMVDKPGYSYSLSTLLNTSTAFLKTKHQPVVRLDWRISNQSCSRAKQSSSYACKSNTKCVDFDAKVGGYLCNCHQGYVGNPYHYPGCIGWYLQLPSLII